MEKRDRQGETVITAREIDCLEESLAKRGGTERQTEKWRRRENGSYVIWLRLQRYIER